MKLGFMFHPTETNLKITFDYEKNNFKNSIVKLLSFPIVIK